MLSDFVLHKMFTSSDFHGIVALELGAGTGISIIIQYAPYDICVPWLTTSYLTLFSRIGGNITCTCCKNSVCNWYGTLPLLDIILNYFILLDGWLPDHILLFSKNMCRALLCESTSG